MPKRVPLSERLFRVFGIVVALSTYAAFAAGMGVSMLPESQASFSLEGSLYVSLALLLYSWPLAFLFISIGVPIFALPVVLAGQRLRLLSSLRNTMIASASVGLIAGAILVGPIFARLAGWPLIAFLGSSTGGLGGWIWWHWIGAHEAAMAISRMEKPT